MPGTEVDLPEPVGGLEQDTVLVATRDGGAEVVGDFENGQRHAGRKAEMAAVGNVEISWQRRSLTGVIGLPEL